MKRTILIFCMVLLGFAMTLGFNVMSNPQLNDVSSDLIDPPTFPVISQQPEFAGKSFEFPERNVELLRDSLSEDLGIDSPESPAELKRKVRELLAKLSWQIVTEDFDAESIEATATTRIMRFKDDFVVRIRPRANGGTRVDFRSRSRIGKSDLGANAARIRDFRSELLRD